MKNEHNFTPEELQSLLESCLREAVCTAVRLLHGDCLVCQFSSPKTPVFDIQSYFSNWEIRQADASPLFSEGNLASLVSKRVLSWEWEYQEGTLTLLFEEGWRLCISPFDDATEEEGANDVWVLCIAQRQYIGVSTLGQVTMQEVRGCHEA